MKSYATLADLLSLGDREDWRDDALCAQVDSSDLFFPEEGHPNQAAKQVCGLCEVRAECLAYALTNREPAGVWGGLSELERRELLKLPRVSRPRLARDAEILRRIAAGETAPAVAEQVGVSVRTVERAIARNTATTPPAVAA